ncbi:hypothetical protein Y032_0045g1255 [Ancylostoma ceylanicum]|uniref:Uncharacterized protein n=1 Tax=Ancylostoma ceylanicum TaxID=53326 RepID=A0A016UCQ6_9BILA|nr:hypothetical protein Y032_0045g1255 [Ancylostoma ceylanicum]
MWRSALILCLLAVATQSAAPRSGPVGVGFRKNCVPKPSGGCKCSIKDGSVDTEIEFATDDDCRKPIEMVTADNKRKLGKEIEQKFGGFKDNCFPKPSGGCKCNVDLGHGEQVVEYSSDAQCKKSAERQTADNKKDLNQEIKDKFGSFRENCFPKPSGGCKCNEKDARGNEVVKTYNSASQCQIRSKRDVAVGTQRQPANVNQSQQKYRQRDSPSQNVRDPVRERAQANYAAVLDELKNKFKGLKEGCFPRPKGCLCVIGKTAEGRDITERRMNDADCKCREGERGPGCPAA